MQDFYGNIKRHPQDNRVSKYKCIGVAVVLVVVRQLCYIICGPALTYHTQKGSSKFGQNSWVCDEEFTDEISTLVQLHDKLLFVGIWCIVTISGIVM